MSAVSKTTPRCLGVAAFLAAASGVPADTLAAQAAEPALCVVYGYGTSEEIIATIGINAWADDNRYVIENPDGSRYTPTKGDALINDCAAVEAIRSNTPQALNYCAFDQSSDEYKGHVVGVTHDRGFVYLDVQWNRFTPDRVAWPWGVEVRTCPAVAP